MATQTIQNVKQTEIVHGPTNQDTIKRKLSSWSAFAILLVLAILWMLPAAWAIDTSFKPEGETTALPLSWLASAFTAEAYVKVFQAGDLPRWYFNSIFTSVFISAASVLLASMAAFAFSRVPFRGRGIVFWVILAGLMVPGQVLIVPLFSIMQAFKMVDTYWGIILPQIASPFAMFIFKQYFDGIPFEYDEAARVDGCSRWRIYWQIWMPLSKPIIATVAIFAFVGSWNNFIWPFIVITSTDMMTIPVGLATVQSSFGIRYAQIMASAVLGGLPAVIVFAFFQRQIVQGLAGGLKE
ncbi:sugar ABC transporter permease [Reticulibacter mediterranei]|uniref:Sugar ABC transporter permease n=1 Tax=Reticulibacter mediterranei TaxID=2778369 RepID=A0A8J3IFK6_9CHLR|nr:carbohydrate ABC transporter permease [Reticulibacter mediterranei]GHO91610.1 sugar ABC transporter permease [Reticulibacter mediterranei]